MCEHVIYQGPTGVVATLTTHSSQSHHGIPVLRIEGTDAEGNSVDGPDLGPSDLLPSALSAAELVSLWINNRTGNGFTPRNRHILQDARKFLAQLG